MSAALFRAKVTSRTEKRENAIYGRKQGVNKNRGFPGGSDSKESAAIQQTQVQSLGREDLLEKRMTTHSSSLAWRIPWVEEPGRL